MCASFFTLIVAVIEVDGTGMSRASVYDQFVCRIWLTGVPVWIFLITSTYAILITALERYIAVVHPVFYNVRTNMIISYRHSADSLLGRPRSQTQTRHSSEPHVSHDDDMQCALKS